VEWLCALELGSVPDWIQSIAVVAATAAAIRGLNTWRTQRESELAEAILTAFYRVRRAFGDVRSPLYLAGEGRTRPGDDHEPEERRRELDQYFVALERLQRYVKDFEQIDVLQFKARARFGQDAAKPFDLIRKQHTKIVVACQMVLRAATQGREIGEELRKISESATQSRSAIGQEPDEIDKAVAEAVTQVEDICRPRV
jgi:hypothetical protein